MAIVDRRDLSRNRSPLSPLTMSSPISRTASQLQMTVTPPKLEPEPEPTGPYTPSQLSCLVSWQRALNAQQERLRKFSATLDRSEKAIRERERNLDRRVWGIEDREAALDERESIMDVRGIWAKQLEQKLTNQQASLEQRAADANEKDRKRDKEMRRLIWKDLKKDKEMERQRRRERDKDRKMAQLRQQMVNKEREIEELQSWATVREGMFQDLQERADGLEAALTQVLREEVTRGKEITQLKAALRRRDRAQGARNRDAQKRSVAETVADTARGGVMQEDHKYDLERRA